jgi:uncharacterized protein YutE (UPF0331/DUF86 family)
MTADPAVLTRRISMLRECLTHLSAPDCGDAARLRGDPVLRAAVERWLQVAVEACVDVAHHVVAAEGWTPPATAREAFEVLAAHSRIDAALASRLGRAAALRNVLVHDYVAVDLEQIARIVRDDLGDLEAFALTAAAWR